MSTTIQNSITPIIDQNRRFQTWHMREIYDGPGGTGKYVPNVDDLVIDWSTGFWRVVSVDYYNTNLSYLEQVNIGLLGGGIDAGEQTVLTSVGPNPNALRIYVDTSVIPHTLTIDSRMPWYGAENHHVKVFKGTDISASDGVVISCMIDAGGNIVSEDIPLVNSLIPNATNYTQKAPMVAWCSESVKTGDVAMVVTYTADGRISAVDKFVIVNTNFIRTTDQAAKIVASIDLESPFLSKQDQRLIECPINMITQSLPLSGRVSYTDGTSTVLPIDGVKFSLAGFNTFIASQIGQTVDLVLCYHLTGQELAVGSTPALPDRRMTKTYKLRTMDINTFYDIKLFACPVWNVNRYDLRFYLYNLNRADVFDVTNWVEYAVGKPEFNGTLLNQAQSLSVAFNMSNLGPGYSNYRQVQHLTVTLLAPGNAKGVNSFYTISYTDGIRFGERLKANILNQVGTTLPFGLDVSNGATSADEWLVKHYLPLIPLYHPSIESEAPTPSHATIVVNDQFIRTVPVEDLVNPIKDVSNQLVDGMSVRIKLILKVGDDIQELALVPLVATTTV